MYHANINNFASDANTEFSLSLFETAFYLGGSILAFGEVVEELDKVEAELKQRNPFNSVWKLEALARKVGRAKSPERLLWVIHGLRYTILNDQISGSDLSVAQMLGKAKNQNGKGLIDLVLFE